MQNFKESLSKIELSEEQKQKLAKNLKRPAKKVSKLPLVILPVFLSVALFFLFITLTGDSQNFKPVAKSSSSITFISSYPLSGRAIVFAIINSVLILMNSFMFRRNLKMVPRMQKRAFLQELHVYIHKPVFLIILIVIAQLLLWGISISTMYAAVFNQALFIVLIILTLWQSLAYRTRNDTWCSCPHCQMKMTRWQIHKKSKWNKREKCDTCQQPIVVTSESYNDKVLGYFVLIPGIGLYTTFDFHFMLAGMYVMSLYFLNFYVYFPYTMVFDRDEEA